MGRSKFPGKPSKSVMKERIRVLHKDENGKSGKDASCNTNKNNVAEGSSHTGTDCSLYSSSTTSKKDQHLIGELNISADVVSKNKPANYSDLTERSIEIVTGEIGQNLQGFLRDVLEQDKEKKLSSTDLYVRSISPNVRGNGNKKYSLAELDKLIKKKTVTFKNVLETSDDNSIIKKIHNPLNKGPLVSIMKKECHTSQGCMTRGDGIVRPSRLTEILKNNENIDKTKSLSFRSVQTSNNFSDSIESKKLEAANVRQDHSSIREGSPKTMFLSKESVDKPGYQSNEDTYSQLLDKWELYNLYPKSDNFDSGGDHAGDEFHKRSPEKKDNTVQNKTILRQPRLLFEPQVEILAKGKQRTLNNGINTNLLTNNICIHSVCGVCNTSVSSKHLQNRKYGTIACDACRKFISKITKKTVSSSMNPITTFKIQCSNKDGECIISSLPKNSVKSFKKICGERCSACWLKKCIQAFHFPSGHKMRLNAMLSETHKNQIDVKLTNKPYDTLSSSPVNTFKYRSELLSDSGQINSQTNAMSWTVISTSDGLNGSVKSQKEFASANKTTEPFSDNNLTFNVFPKIKQPSMKSLSNEDLCSNGKHSRFYSNTVQKKSQTILCKSLEQSTNAVVTPDYPKRQKIDFKGPRVKHVCRSASIALGQQIATFSNDDEITSKLLLSKYKIENSSLTNSLLGNIYFCGSDQENNSQKTTDDVKELRKQIDEGEKMLEQGFALNSAEGKRQQSQNIFVNTGKIDKKPALSEKTFPYENKYCQLQKSAQKYSANKNLFMLAHRNISALSKRKLMRITKARNLENKSKIISVDFWDTYVPAEVNQTGFGLILTEPAPVCALCFLCGSMDFENLLFCASCCEPYHSYCIPEENNSSYTIFQKKSIPNNIENMNELSNQLNWVCPRCTVCYTCNMSSGEKVKCKKCKKNYHSTCMGTSKGLLGADRPLICRSCLKCQTCSTTKVSKYVGNQPFCMQCFKLRKAGIRCPLCNNFFDNILIILECGICEKLIHAKCEGLTEEQSNLLSNLPGYIKFVCKKCSFASDNAKILAKEWREAVYEELKGGLLDVLKLLSRSRQANVLKRNTEKNCLCSLNQIRKNHHILSIDKFENSQTKNGASVAYDCTLNNLPGSGLYSKCFCSNGFFRQPKLNNLLSLFDIKNKIINGEYVSLFDFNADMSDVIMPLKNDELILTYKEILSEKFSWFQNETKTCTDALEEDMFESCSYSFQLDDVIIENQNTNTKFPHFVGKVLNSLKQEADNRVCIFCLKEGDGGNLQESRLLYYGYNAWIHANCALWSNDVYEEFDGTLQNVPNALNSGRLIKCALCNWSGATVKCVVKSCCRFYHFQCARKAECVFKADKTVYCSIHRTEEKENNSSTKETFTVLRPLYIEFDRCRRKFVEPSKVQFMVGSLSVIQLGNVYSKFSDTSEAIVPINFVCTRLYWSCIEPWKIVKYSVRTLIQHSSVTFANDIGKHFTVDHSNNVTIVEKGLSQIASWQNTLSRDETLDASLHCEYGQFSNLRFSTDGDNHNETIPDSCMEEEPQSTSDLLPPEIKDAIFEDLPHDILDGISMLDIFPKLMIYEDLIAIEGKSDNMLLNEVVENCALQISEDCPSFNSLNKQESNNKYASNIINNAEDTDHNTAHTICPKRELHRSNSEVFLRSFDGYRSQQRSSSVTWSCKFDNTRRCFKKALSDVGLSETSAFNSNCKKFNNECDDYKISQKKNYLYEENGDFTQRKKENVKLMQLDGTDDTILGYFSTHVQNSTTKSPVKCERCHCTYRTFDSFQRHLSNCEQISTSESETETSNTEASRPTIVFQKNSVKNNLQLYHNRLESEQILPAKISLGSDPNVISSEYINPQNIYVSSSVDYKDGFYFNINKTVDVDNKNNSTNVGCDEGSWHNGNGVCVDSFDKCFSKNKKVKCNYNTTISNSKAKKQQINVYAKTNPETFFTPETVDNINNKTEYNPQTKHTYLQFLNQPLTLNNQCSQKEQQSQQQQFVVIQQSVGNNQPLFIQQVSSPTTIPQTIFPVVLQNNSMQYASIPTSTSPLMQGSILQTDASGNVILSSGLQMLSMPSLQLTSQSSPQLIGAFNHTQPLHLGSNAMLIGGAATMELMPNANQVLLSAPPIYYGLETIVQNTVMSSQQFVSTAVQGVLSQNSSFSATTTQVFQSSKFEPVNDGPNGYVVLNNADGTALVVPQTNLLSGFLNTNSTHDFHNNYTQDFGNMCGTHPQTFIQQPQPASVLPLIPSLSDMGCIPVDAPVNQLQTNMNLESNSLIVSTGIGPTKLVSSTNNNVSRKNASNTPSDHLIQGSPLRNMENYDTEKIPALRNDQNNDLNVEATCKRSDISEAQGKFIEANNIHLKHKVHVKPKVVNKYIKRSRTMKNSQTGSKLEFRSDLQKEFKLYKSKESLPNNLINRSTRETSAHHKIMDECNNQYLPILNTNYSKEKADSQSCSKISRNSFEVRTENSEKCLRLKDPVPNTIPASNNRAVSQFYVANTTKLPLTTSSFGTNSINVPTNIVSPILQTHQVSNTPSRPTNRVLPMQSIQKNVDEYRSKGITLKRPSFTDNGQRLDTTFSDVEIKKRTLPSVQGIERNNTKILVSVGKELDLTKGDVLLKSKNEELKTNDEMFPMSDDSCGLRKSDSKSSNNIPLEYSEKEDENNISNEVFPLKTFLYEEKNDLEKKNSMIESIEVFPDTQTQKSFAEDSEKIECLNVVTSTDTSKMNFKNKSPKRALADQYSIPNQSISRHSSKKQFKKEDLKKSFEPHLIYEIQSEDGFNYTSNSIADVWEKVFETVQSARRAHGLSSLPIGPFADMCGVQIIGLKTNALKYLIEQLPGTERCTKYTPKYHKNVSVNAGSEYVQQDQEELFENIYGAIRCEPFTKRSDYDLFSWLASRHRKQPKQIFVQPSETELIARRCTGNLPMAMKYRTLKETCKHNVGVFRSLIHGRGLFCTKDIEAGEMVIEYAGELIRSTLTDKRERFYDSRGIGCYMFKIDEHFVVDATMRGNAARFINHSCEPNCYSKVVDILGHKHIIIFSLRRIVQGEELTYDYKFPFEDIKIPCSCGSKKCRKYLN